MRKSCILLFLLLPAVCKKVPDVNSIDDVPGLWRWKSTCGGFGYECKYGSKADYATVNFGSNGLYTEKHNDTVFIQTNYTLINYDGTFGTLIFEDTAVTRPITVINSHLLITRGEMPDSYSKIK